MRKCTFIFTCLLLVAKMLAGQTCTNAGQTPASAILLCGSDSYTRSVVPVCGQTDIPVPCPASASYQNTNPTWFKMDCFGSGTLGFIITPNDGSENYDWELFDISSRNPNDAFTDPSLFVACNWCPDPGETGASIDGNNLAVCAQTSQELFSKMPDIIQGHEYLLMVSHRASTEFGFRIVITGGSASVTDPAEPQLFNARLSCSSTQIVVLLNKKMYCSTISSDGSEFLLNTSLATITSAFSVDCSNDETNLVSLTLSSPLPAGNYTVSVQPGNDGNTIKDHCGRFIAPGDLVPLIMPSLEPARMDSLSVPACGPASARLVFRKPLQCSSVALDGSDFIITGPQPVLISNVTISCNTQSGTTMIIDLEFSSPVMTQGNYLLSLTTGSDGNTLVTECGAQVPAASLPFTAKPAVSAAFNFMIRPSCREDTIYFSHNGNGGVNNWNWTFDNVSAVNVPSHVKIFPAEGDHTIQLIVSNGDCQDTASENIHLDNKVIAAFEAPSRICPEDAVQFVNNSTGTVDSWEWNFGNNLSSNLVTPAPFHFPVTGTSMFYVIKLVASNNAMNCKDSAVKRIEVLNNCYIAVPTAFSPNGDGLNDYLSPNNALKADHLLFQVYDRLGQLVFETKDWTRKWDGRLKGILQPTGVYAWILTYTDHDTGEKIFRKGTSVLIR